MSTHNLYFFNDQSRLQYAMEQACCPAALMAVVYEPLFGTPSVTFLTQQAYEAVEDFVYNQTKFHNCEARFVAHEVTPEQEAGLNFGQVRVQAEVEALIRLISPDLESST